MRACVRAGGRLGRPGPHPPENAPSKLGGGLPCCNGELCVAPYPLCGGVALSSTTPNCMQGLESHGWQVDSCARCARHVQATHSELIQQFHGCRSQSKMCQNCLVQLQRRLWENHAHSELGWSPG